MFFFLFEVLGLLFFTTLGIAGVALTPNIIVASIISGAAGSYSATLTSSATSSMLS